MYVKMFHNVINDGERHMQVLGCVKLEQRRRLKVTMTMVAPNDGGKNAQSMAETQWIKKR